jgi:hypothetical protein
VEYNDWIIRVITFQEVREINFRVNSALWGSNLIAFCKRRIIGFSKSELLEMLGDFK